MDYIQEIPNAIEILTKEASSELDRRYAMTWLDRKVEVKVSRWNSSSLPLVYLQKGHS